VSNPSEIRRPKTRVVEPSEGATRAHRLLMTADKLVIG
jgi:hypothetical protein